MKVVVLGGGDSTEREVSLRSAAAVKRALETAGFETEIMDPQTGFAVLDTVHSGSIVFPILHGKNGEDGTIQAALEQRGIPFLGTTSQPSAICFDKWQTRQVLETNNLPIARGHKVTRDTYPSNELIDQPHVLKVTQGGSSIGTYIVRDPTKLDAAQIDAVFELGTEAVVEQLVEGIEITVPVLDTKALSVIEVQPPQNQDFDYLNKYNGVTKEICPPVSVSEEQQRKAQQLAETAHQVLGCRHLSRTDMIVAHDGSIVILETNTMPGMTEQSLFPLAANAEGMSMPELMERFVDLVKRDYNL